MSRLALLLAWLAFCGAAIAQEAPPKGEVHFGLGNFRPADDHELPRRDGNFSFDLGFDWRHSRHLYYSQDADTPLALRSMLGGAGSDRATLSVSGLGGLLKIMQPVGPFEFYAGAGFGWYASRISASSISILTLQTRTVDRSDDLWGSQLVAGVNLRASPTSAWTIQYKRMVVNPNFGPGIGTVTAGGTMVQILYRAGFGRCPECGG
jgi:hypothetical protein